MAQGLIADIGGTNARFALVEDGNIKQDVILKCSSYVGVEAAIRAYFDQIGVSEIPKIFALAIAAPIQGDQIDMTNHHWSFSVSEVKEALDFDEIILMNDFEAIATAVPYFDERHMHKIGGGSKELNANIAVIGPGTGLGTAMMIVQDGHYFCVSGEGGHVTMPIRNEREFSVFMHLQANKYTHVSGERVCSGKGLMNLYDAIRAVDEKMDRPALLPEDITQKAKFGTCEICLEAVHLMFTFLGRLASNLVLSINAYGGVYIAGGIVPQMLELFESSNFRNEFESKGNYKDYMKAIPSYVVTHEYPAFEGLKQEVLKKLR